MNISYYVPADQVLDPLRESILKSFPGAKGIDAGPEAVATVRGSELVLVDVTGAGAGAAYVAGLADAFGKKCVLLMAIREAIPALRHLPAIVHGWNFDLLAAELRKHAGAPLVFAPAPPNESPEGKFQRLFGDLLAAHGYRHRGPVELENESTFTLREQEMELPLAQDIARRAKSLNLRVRLL